jgi:hypothetical protein
MLETEKLRQSLLSAYEIIRGNTETICDTSILLAPLLKSLEPEYEHLSPRSAYLQCQAEMLNELTSTKKQSLAFVDAAIRRLKEA